ncbi:MAG: globin family protein [Prochloraceae cyanobacterium]
MNIEILEQTFAIVRPKSDKFARSFYQNLFLKYPEVKPLFSNTSMQEQEKKLIASLVLVIDNIRHLAYLEHLLKNLGKRHLKYGTISEHYQLVGDSLLTTLGDYLESQWTPEVQQTWADAYKIIVNLMIDGAKEEHELKNISGQDFDYGIKRLKFEAIARKALRNGNSPNLVVQILMEHSYFQETMQKLGKEKTFQLISEVIEKASLKEQNMESEAISKERDRDASASPFNV